MVWLAIYLFSYKKPSPGQSRPQPLAWLWPTAQSGDPKAISGQAKARAFSQSQAGTSLPVTNPDRCGVVMAICPVWIGL